MLYETGGWKKKRPEIKVATSSAFNHLCEFTDGLPDKTQAPRRSRIVSSEIPRLKSDRFHSQPVEVSAFAIDTLEQSLRPLKKPLAERKRRHADKPAKIKSGLSQGSCISR